MAIQEIRVPDIGDFKDVEIIEVLVKVGDTIKAEDSLITVESDKASMEIPSPLGGVVKDVRIQTGERVSKGSLLLSLEVGKNTVAPPAPPPPPPPVAPKTTPPPAPLTKERTIP